MPWRPIQLVKTEYLCLTELFLQAEFPAILVLIEHGN